jgi:hypothetical protein
MKDDYSQSVSMQCSTCGGNDFDFEDDCGPIRCVGCDRVFAREELIRENGARIETEVEEVFGQITADLTEDFSKIFKGFK